MAPRIPSDSISHNIVAEYMNETRRNNVGHHQINRPMTLPDLLVTSQIHRAVDLYGWPFIIDWMQQPGAQLTYRDADGNTVLHHAFELRVREELIDTCAWSKWETVLEFLNTSNVDVNAQIRMNIPSMAIGYTPLHLAVDNAQLDIAACLLNNNASIYIRDDNGMTPVHVAILEPQSKMIDLLLSYDRDCHNPIDNFGHSHFIAACVSTHSFFAERFLRKAVSPEVLISERCKLPCFNGWTPMHFAAMFGCLETVKILTVYGADCYAMTPKNESPLNVAGTTKIHDFLDDYCKNHHYHGKEANRATCTDKKED